MNWISIRNALVWLLVILLTSCGKNFPLPHTPAGKLTEKELGKYTISYCWQDPNGRWSKARPYDKEVVIVVSAANGTKTTILRNKMNLPDQQLSDFVIYKNGCVEQGDDLLRYIGFAISWRPLSSEITYSEGSDRSSTRFDSRFVENFTVTNGNLVNLVNGYKDYFWSPRGIYWSNDGEKFATLGRDISFSGSNSDNIWVYDISKKSFTKITNIREAGDFIANSSWSKDGSMIAVEYRKQSGIGIAKFDESNNKFSYLEITHQNFPELSEHWPYVYESILQLMYDAKNINFNGYVSTNSFPVFVNNDKQIIFAASNKSGQGTLFIVNSDGTHLEPLLPKLAGLVFMPQLSPNGRELAFVRYPAWNNRRQVEIGSIDIVTNETKSLVVLSETQRNQDLIISGMDWSPDGKYLTFSSNHTGESDIYIMSSDGSSWINLTESKDGIAVSPIWKP